MGSESPCCGGGLSGISVLYSLHILIKQPTNPNFQHSPPPPPPTNFYTLKVIRKIIQNFSKNSWIKDSNLTESFLDWMKSWLAFKTNWVEINEK